MTRSIKIDVNGNEIAIVKNDNNDYISLTDIARHKDAEHTDSII
ncbi:MAG: hypothetical protein PHE56_03405 [Bacteroidales bacterium]|nr:hypothetical protein [Bacteroidales bacterium]